MALVLRPNDYKYNLETDPPNDGRPVQIASRGRQVLGKGVAEGSNRLDRTWKFRQETIAGVLYDAAAVLGDCRAHSLG